MIQRLRYRIGVFSLLGWQAALPGMAQAADDSPSLDRVVVTGTREEGRQARASATPIDVVSAGDLRATGQTNLLDALRNVLPSLGTPAVGYDIGALARTFQLRGLSPAHTLVLVNGKRRHASASIYADSDPAQGANAVDEGAVAGEPRLRSGQRLADAAQAALELNAAALLLNCSQPEVMGDAVDVLHELRRSRGLALPIGVYANAFPPQPKAAQANDGLDDIRSDLGPGGYLAWARDWHARGADIIGGCCGIGPEHIALLRQAFAGGAAPPQFARVVARPDP
jgi:hypothetical protein